MIYPLSNLATSENSTSKSIYENFQPVIANNSDITPTMTPAEIANIITDKLIRIVSQNLQAALKTTK